jgi:cell division protein FtsN
VTLFIVIFILVILNPVPSQYSSEGAISQPSADTMIRNREAQVEETSGEDQSSVLPSFNTSTRQVQDSQTPAEQTIEPTRVEIPAESNSVADQQGIMYYIIAGSFKILENAKILQQQLVNEGYTSKILESNNHLYRVTLGEYNSQKTANEAFHRLRKEKQKDVWIMERK